MTYETYEPIQELSGFIKCYWTLESPAEQVPAKQTIVPDGCMEMIFHCGDLYRQYVNNNETIIQPRFFVFGQLTKPLQIQPTGVTNIFSVRFHPNGFLPFSAIPLKEIENTALPLEKLFGEEGKRIGEDIITANTAEEKIRLAENFLCRRLNTPATFDRVVRSTVETILSANGQLSVEELSKHININRRQLERKFSSVIGLSPKQLSKTIRLQAILKMLINKQYTSLTELAYEADYYDQAHFIKDFREFTGCTPKEFYGNHLKMSALFYGEG